MPADIKIEIRIKGTDAVVLQLRRAARNLFCFMLELKFNTSARMLNDIAPEILLVEPKTLKKMIDLVVDPVASVTVEVDQEDFPEERQAIFCWTQKTFEDHHPAVEDFHEHFASIVVGCEKFYYCTSIIEHLQWEKD